MGKASFIEALRARLGQLDPAERARQLAYYAELLDDMVEDGMTEEAAVERLGGPDAVAEAILQEQPLSSLIKTRVRPSGGWTALAVILAVLGSPIWLPIALVLLAVAVSVGVVIWSLAAVLFVIVVGIVIGGLALLVTAVWTAGHSLPMLLLLVGGALCCGGLAVLAYLVAVWAIKGLAWLSQQFFRWIKSCFIRKGGAA